MVKILLDPGHGPGREFNRGGVLFNEGDETFEFSRLIKKELENYENCYVKMTRNKVSDYPDLEERGRAAKGFDLFISNHSNAYDGSARGTEIWNSVKNPSYTKLANMFLRTATSILDTPNRGIKYKRLDDGRDWYGVLRYSGAKISMLCEWFFHTDLQDSKNYLKNKEKLAKAIAKDIATYYNLKLKSKNTSSKSSGKYTLKKDVPGYTSAEDAKAGKATVYEKGQYHIYKTYNGMINITRTPGVPGAWINPKDN